MDGLIDRWVEGTSAETLSHIFSDHIKSAIIYIITLKNPLDRFNSGSSEPFFSFLAGKLNAFFRVDSALSHERAGCSETRLHWCKVVNSTTVNGK